MKFKKASLPSLLLVIALFLVYSIFHSKLELGFSFVIFAICVIHLLVVLINKWVNKVSIGRSVHICNLAMLTISCFSLNKEIQIFAPFTPWVNMALIALFAILLLEEYLEINNKIWDLFYALVITTGLWVSLYFTFILAPILHIGLIALIVFGLGIHVFVPLILSTTLCVFLFNRFKNMATKIGISLSLLLLIGSVFFFFNNLKNANDAIERVNVTYATSEDQILPRWVSIAQKIPTNKWTEMILVGDFKFELFDDWFMDRSFNGGGNSLSEMGVHEPFLNLAKLIGYYKLDLSDDERISILKTNFNKRHQTNRKLWTGEHLETTQAITDVKLYPDFRLAYTQKTLFIKNISESEWQQEEALYTFQLPDDAVVNSMSLWVNGKERKSYLTTKEKADSAYVEIVGVQNRDPALLHWQEGNKVSVTVFPCTNKENRMLKVGYTMPLLVDNNNLIYNDIFIEGPNFNDCKNNIQITSSIAGTKIETEKVAVKFTASKYKGSYTGNQSWSISTPIVSLSNQSFTFNEKTFKVEAESEELIEKKVVNVILDLNSSWTKSEYKKILSDCAKQTFWYSPDQTNLVAIEPAKQDEIWNSMSELKFNLIPFHKIDPSNSILITKSVIESPSYKELDSCKYSKRLSESMQQNKEPILVITIDRSNEAILYKTLTNFNFLKAQSSTLEKCIESIQSTHFLQNKVAENEVNIDNANLNIVQINDSTISGAPDHLMRMLYAKKIQQQAGKYYFDASNSTNLKTCVDMANEAFVVSPVSSLIVLETDKDYDDFGIDKNKNSLSNATKKGKGAVPEPHEWLMIGIGIIAMFYFIGKQKGLI